MVEKKKVKSKTKPKTEIEEDYGNSANDIIMSSNNEDEGEILTQQNTIQDVIKEIGKALFEKYPKKSSNLTNDNIDGMVQAECLNEYMERNFGYRYSVLDILCKSKRELVISSGGYGIAAFIESIKSVQASIEQHQIPDQLRRMVR